MARSADNLKNDPHIKKSRHRNRVFSGLGMEDRCFLRFLSVIENPSELVGRDLHLNKTRTPSVYMK